MLTSFTTIAHNDVPLRKYIQCLGTDIRKSHGHRPRTNRMHRETTTKYAHIIQCINMLSQCSLTLKVLSSCSEIQVTPPHNMAMEPGLIICIYNYNKISSLTIQCSNMLPQCFLTFRLFISLIRDSNEFSRLHGHGARINNMHR